MQILCKLLYYIIWGIMTRKKIYTYLVQMQFFSEYTYIWYWDLNSGPCISPGGVLFHRAISLAHPWMLFDPWLTKSTDVEPRRMEHDWEGFLMDWQWVWRDLELTKETLRVVSFSISCAIWRKSRVNSIKQFCFWLHLELPAELL